LLEDVNLSGARGILVNITAGSNLSIGEFDEVGNTVKEVACDDATVVVGTVIDPDMEDDLRVTVVATGLGTQSIRALAPEKKSEDVALLRPVDVETEKEIEEEVVLEQPDYSAMDRPTVIRKDPKVAQSYTESMHDKEMEYLDIPAFLRRQAD
jgi:cell division protein FtsZ